MLNPYLHKPQYQFWRQAVATLDPNEVDPVVVQSFGISPTEWIATAGSCFAQHIAQTLIRENYRFLVTEDGPRERTFGVFPARFGNIYTIRQLLQLFERAYGLFEPADTTWQWKDGRVVDPFRPRSEPDGFESASALALDRQKHLAAVRQLFETADVFIFTLGLTEAWQCKTDGAVVPLAPGVHGQSTEHEYEFINFNFTAIYEDILRWIDLVRKVNPNLKILLTVSPVPLVATYEPRHVLVSNTYSKSVLRAIAGDVTAVRPDIAYFPSYEIITGAHNRARYFAPDMREVTAEGVAAVMALFKRHYLNGDKLLSAMPKSRKVQTDPSREVELKNLSKILCEEESLDVGHVR